MDIFGPDPQDTRHHILSSNNCIINQDGVIIKANGFLKVDVEPFLSSKCYLSCQRLGGNGHVLVRNGEQNISTIVSSKVGQTIEFTIENKILEISRPQNAVGALNIVQITLSKDGEMSPKNWKAILSKCGSYKLITLVNNKLLASEGGRIASEHITQLTTLPHNAFVKKGEYYKFVIPCEITEIVLDINTLKPQEPLFAHLSSPPAISTQPDIIGEESPTNQVINNNPPKVLQAQSQTQNPFVYNSSHSGGIVLAQLFKVAEVTKHGDAIMLGRNSSFCLPLSNLEPNQDYIIALTAKKLNGNGKVAVSIETNTGSPRTSTITIFLLNHKKNCVTLNTGPLPAEGETYCVRVFRPEHANGEVLLTNLSVIRGLDKTVISDFDWTAMSTTPQTNKFYTEDKLIPSPPSQNTQIARNQDRKFVIVIPSYNNEAWVERNILSALNQQYKNFRVIFVDDCSSDRTFEKAKTIATNHLTKCSLIKNTIRKGALENLYNAIHSCADEEIVLTLDGDDWLAHENVLSRLNEVYKSGDIWLTYGQYKNHPDGAYGVAQLIPEKIIESNSFRSHTWCASHLRTFYAWLFKKIDRNDLLMQENVFYPMTWDFAIMFPMLEMAGAHSKFLNDILYIYNLENPINDHKVNRQLQASLDRSIRSKPKYSPATINFTETPRTNIGLMLIATGKYTSFLKGIIESADKFFFNDSRFEITYYLFSDQDMMPGTCRNVVPIHIDHKPFPHASMDRFRHFSNYRNALSLNDYLFYVDVDCMFVDNVKEDILGKLVGVRHCGFYSGGGSFETNSRSALYLPRDRYKHYYGGGFSGGEAASYLDLSQWCADKIEEDLANGIMPVWHDETALNTYFAYNPPEKSLSPSYHFPQKPERYFRAWDKERFTPKIILLEKKHGEVR